MPSNYSSSANDSLPAPFFFQCFDSITAGYIFLATTYANILLFLPLCVYILYLGFQQWKQQRSVSSAAPLSLSDFVTYNMVVMELIGIVGNIVSIWAGFTFHPMLVWSGMLIGVFPWYAQMLFPILTCVERYLAVVHPITYVRLRRQRGLRIRNISTVYIWLSCFGSMCLAVLSEEYLKEVLIANTVQLALFIVTVIFCSLSILCALTRPRPGDRARVDQSKQRAFNTVMIIMGVLLLRFGGYLMSTVVEFSPTLSYDAKCVMKVLPGWFNLPSSLLLPLLFLHRAGKLPGCKHITQSG